MYNAESLSPDGELRWSVLWEDIIPAQGGMLVLRDKFDRPVIKVVSTDLLAMGIKDGNVHVAALDVSDGSESVALTDTGVAADIVTNAAGHFFGMAKVVSGEIVISAYKEDASSSYIFRLVRIAVDSAGTCTRSESSDIDYTPQAIVEAAGLRVPFPPGNHFQTPIVLNTPAPSGENSAPQLRPELGLNSAGQAMWVGNRYFSSSSGPDHHEKLVSVGSGGESGRLQYGQSTTPKTIGFTYYWYTTTGKVTTITRPAGNLFNSWTFEAPFSTGPTDLFTPDSESPLDWTTTGPVISPFDADKGWAYHLDNPIPGNAHRADKLSIYDPSVDYAIEDAVGYFTSDVCPNIDQPEFTLSTSQKVESDGTLHVILHSATQTYTNPRLPFDAGYGIVAEGGVEAVMLTHFPFHVSGRPAVMVLSSDDEAYCCYRTTLGDVTGYLSSRYSQYGGVLLPQWSWFNLNEQVDDIDGSDNTYYADAFTHDLQSLGKLQLVWLLLLEDTDWTIEDLIDANDEAFLRASIEHTYLNPAASGPHHLEATIENTRSGNTEFEMGITLELSAGSTSGLVDMSLFLIIDSDTELNGDLTKQPGPIEYTATDVDLLSTSLVTLTTTASEVDRTIEFDAGPPPETMIMPTFVELQTTLGST